MRLSEWRLAVDRRSNDIWPALAMCPISARIAFESLPVPCLHRAVRIRLLSAGNGPSASAARPPSQTGLALQVASASWLGPINLRGHRLRRGRPRATPFALRLPPYRLA